MEWICLGQKYLPHDRSLWWASVTLAAYIDRNPIIQDSSTQRIPNPHMSAAVTRFWPFCSFFKPILFKGFWFDFGNTNKKHAKTIKLSQVKHDLWVKSQEFEIDIQLDQLDIALTFNIIQCISKDVMFIAPSHVTGVLAMDMKMKPAQRKTPPTATVGNSPMQPNMGL